MIVGKKALVGILGIGAAVAALGWMLLPKNSKVRKAIGVKAKEVGGILKNHVDDMIHVTSEKKPATSRSRA